jgi:outer membrane protein OmpA-like peptidoglycan-associated protein
MRKLINLVTALSMALYVVPPFAASPAMAEGTTTTTTTTTEATAPPPVVPAGAFLVDLDGAPVICLPDKLVQCPDGAFCVIAKTKDQCLKRASKAKSLEAAKAATAGAATTSAGSETTAPADAGTTTATTADTTTATAPVALPIIVGTQTVLCLPDKSLACPDGAICVRTQSAATCDAAAQHRVKALEAEQKKAAAAAAAAAATKTTTEATVPDQSATAQTPPDQTATDAGTATAATADTTTVAPGAADGGTTTTATPDTTTTAGTTATADAGTAATTAPAQSAPANAITVMVGVQPVICLPGKAGPCPDGAICVRVKQADRCDAAAKAKVDKLAAAAAEDKASIAAAKKAADDAAKTAEANGQPLVDAPKPTQDAVQSLDSAIAIVPADDAGTVTADQPVAAPVVAAAEVATQAPKPGTKPAQQAPSPDAVVTEQTVTKADTRSSAQEFAAAPAVTADGKKKTGLSDLEKVGLIALGALVVGEILKGNKEVVSNTGDRVVVKDNAGNYQIYKDDDVLLRQPGTSVRTETFNDGSTRTTVTRSDGTSVVTIRDATGRVLRRSAYDARGIETVLIDDMIPEQRVDVSQLPPPAPQVAPGDNSALATRLAQIEAQKAGRTFSLRQIRAIPEVKALAQTLPVPNVTFESGSAAIRPDQAENLAALGDLVKELIRKSPNRIFLIEGHTDAVGSAPSNLTLSDRRAESVAKALTEYFGVAPENLVVQGYGESELLIDTQGSERQNRRVVVRDITGLLRQTAN